ncbi:alpha beta hydrolase fold family [Grosmannia clavigera kw1407]|uniref:alcohol O-acetyltransferase n=1 Tax=Grosmannia clavigera (strain kw1407 / UAMH 11150) TaxID=655863 RepID=F0X8U4_GROCL|nr:alpha beta hydrolase fold family [Grosmannia clavigera kw1407]EFX05950.1 alpha beta hydrolase fold family [Grosmannia clavigera kw1407]
MEWFGRASIEFTHSATPLQLTRKSKDKDGDGDGDMIDLPQLCRDSTPPCQLNPLLFNGHLQTFWTAVGNAAPHVYYRRRVFESTHALYGGSFAVDFAVAPHEDEDAVLPPRTAPFDEAAFADIGSDDCRPMLLVLHGLSGGSYEVYLRHCIAPLLADGRDWAVAVINARGCANSTLTSGMLFNARATWDVRQVARWARQTFPNRPLFGLGFSLGANILTNYVGEEGVDCPLTAAVAVGNPFDLQLSNKALQRTFVGKHVYESVMAGNLKALISKHRDVLEKTTDLNFDRIMAGNTLYEFDREVQCTTWGYPTEDAYYRDASSSDSVTAIRIPFLVIQAKDDPIAPEEAVPYGELKLNPYTVLCMTSLGGHLSWFEPMGGRWHAKPVSNFLHKFATEIDLDAIPPRPKDLNTTTPKKGGPKGGPFDPMRRRMQAHHDSYIA